MASRQKLGELLIGAGLIDESQLKAALADQAHWGRPLGKTLIALGYVDEADMLRALGHQLNLPIAQLDHREIDRSVLELVPLEIAEKYHCIALCVHEFGARRELQLGMSDPTDFNALDEIGFRTGLKICPVLVLHGQLDDAINRHYRGVDRCPRAGLGSALDSERRSLAPTPLGEREIDFSAENSAAGKDDEGVEKGRRGGPG